LPEAQYGLVPIVPPSPNWLMPSAFGSETQSIASTNIDMCHS
jgi:hypothetical protein